MTASAATTGSCATAGSWQSPQQSHVRRSPGSGEFATTVNALVHAQHRFADFGEQPSRRPLHLDGGVFRRRSGRLAGVVPRFDVHHHVPARERFLDDRAPDLGVGCDSWAATPSPFGFPIANITGSASYGGGCSSVSSAEVSGQIPVFGRLSRDRDPQGHHHIGAAVGGAASPEPGRWRGVRRGVERPLYLSARRRQSSKRRARSAPAYEGSQTP